MDKGRNLEALAEEDDEEDAEDGKGESESDSSTSDDDAPDEGTRRGEPNKFDILCDGVNNAMALVHTALDELLEMKDEMLKHQLPPTLLIKLATNTGKIFRSISDLNMPVNELVRLVRVYSTPWEEKSAALKKLHEDYEIKQRQLNIAIKRLQLVDAHSKRIAREKRVMNWEKLFAKVMSNKGHGRRWKFLIDTIKQKAKLGLEHVQKFTNQLDESDEEEEDDMPTLQLKHGAESPASVSDKVSETETEQDEDGAGSAGKEEEASEAGSELGKGEEEASEAGSELGKGEAISITIQVAESDEDSEEEEEDVESRTVETPKRVRFAADEKRVSPVKPETKDAEVWTQAPEYDHFLVIRMYGPLGMSHTDIKCSITFGKQFFKTKRLDDEKAKDKQTKGEPKMSEVKKNHYEEATFSMPDLRMFEVGKGIKKSAEVTPLNCQISVHSGPMESIVAMATIDIADLKELDLKTVVLPGPKGDDEVPKTPDLTNEADDDLDSLSSDIDIVLPGDEKQPSSEKQEDYVKDVDPMMFPLYALDGNSAIHKPCGSLPLVIYWVKKEKPATFNRQCGTYGVIELVFELTGIDLQTTSKADLHKAMADEALSVINFEANVQDRAVSALRLSPAIEPPNPPTSPEHESTIPEVIVPRVKEEMITRMEYDKVVEKHSKEMLFLQDEYEKRLQSLVENLQQMEKNQQLQQQQLLQQQLQMQEQQKLLTQHRIPSPGMISPQATLAPPATPARKSVSEVSDVVHKPTIYQPMPPQLPRPKAPKKREPIQPVPKTWDGVPDEFLERLQYFEDESYHHKMALIERTKREIQEDIEKKLAGQHKLSKRDQEMIEALNDVSLPALFMPFQRGSVFNPRAHQYFHPTGSTELRLTQPPSVFQLPPINRNSSSVLNLFELSKNFSSHGQGWLMDRYIQQQEPMKNVHGIMPQPTLPTSQMRSPLFNSQATFDMPSTRGGEEHRTLEAEAEC